MIQLMALVVVIFQQPMMQWECYCYVYWNGHVDPDGNTVFERSYTFNFDTSYNLTSGTETENGITRTFGANWEITGETANVLDSSGTPNAGFTVVSQSDLDVRQLLKVIRYLSVYDTRF